MCVVVVFGGFYHCSRCVYSVYDVWRYFIQQLLLLHHLCIIAMSASPEPRDPSPNRSGSMDRRNDSRDRRDGSRGREDSRDGSRGRADSRDRRGGSRERGGNPRKGSGETSTTSLLVRNLSYRVSADEIREKMEKYGKVRDVYIPRDHYTKQPKGFCFVEFFDGRDAR